MHDPATGLAGRDPEAALAGIPETIPLLADLKDRYLAQATGPRQKALLEPLIDHRLGRQFLEEGLRAANLDPNGPEGRAARQQLDRLSGAFEAVEGKPPTMADIRRLVGDVLPRGEGDPNIVRVGGGEQVEPNGIAQIVPPQETAGGDDVQIAQQQEAQNRPPAKPPASPAPAKKPTPPQSPKPPPIGKQPISKKPDKTGEQITLESEQRRETTLVDSHKRLVDLNNLQLRKESWEEAIRKPLPEVIPRDWQKPLPDDWEATLTRINPNYLKWTLAAAEKNGIPPLLLARLFYKESYYDKNKGSDKGAKGIAQLTRIGVEDLKLNSNTFNYYDPKASIDAGAALLGRYYREFKNWPKAVAAYNMGIGRTYNFFILSNSEIKNSKGERIGWWNGLNEETSTMLQYVFRGQPEVFDKSR